MKLNTESLLRSQKAVAALSASFGALAGAAVAATVAMKAFEKKYRAIADEEILEAKVFYSRVNKTGDFATPEQASAILIGPDDDLLINEAARAASLYQGHNHGQVIGKVENVHITDDGLVMDYTPVVEMEVVEGRTEVVQNVFTDADVTDFDPSTRDPEFPYVITYEEFREGSEEHEQMVLTWFEGDNVLMDDKDDIVTDEVMLVGDCLEKFGQDSHDLNVVYVRNEKMNLEMQVTRSKGTYAREVGGYIAHSESRRPRKFRGDDD